MMYQAEKYNNISAQTVFDNSSDVGISDAEILFELGMIFCSGRDCDIDHVAAHKWFNIAAIKGSERAVAMRIKLSSEMNKAEIAKALREARKWLTMH